MNKEKKKTVVPKLRFPEFREAEKWAEQTLGYFLNIDKKPEKADSFNREKILTVKLHTQGVIKNERSNLLTGGTNYFKRRTGEFIFSKIDLLNGAFGIVPNELDGYVSSTDVPAFSFKENCDPIFFINWLRFCYSKLHVERTGTSNTLKRVSPENFFSLKMFVPIDVREQQKIAATLSSLDDLIAAQSEKIKALQAHKKGLMQRLFPAEGEGVPRLRFGEFRDSGEWEEKPLEKIATFIKGKGVSKSDITSDGALPCIRYGELYTHYSETINDVISYTNLPKDGLVLSQANDVIIPASGETKEDIATASCVTKSGIALGGDLNIIRTKINGVFLSYYLNNAKKHEIAKLAQGISVVHLYPGQLQKLKINVPKEIEQQKIADCLSALDNLITAQNQKLEALKAHKKGLMQQLFPNPNEQLDE